MIGCAFFAEPYAVSSRTLAELAMPIQRAASGFDSVCTLRTQPQRVRQRALIGAACRLAVGRYWLGLRAGGIIRIALRNANASYIVVPPAVRMIIPEANPSLHLTRSLGITFPFNVVVGIPLYHSIAEWLAA